MLVPAPMRAATVDPALLVVLAPLPPNAEAFSELACARWLSIWLAASVSELVCSLPPAPSVALVSA